MGRVSANAEKAVVSDFRWWRWPFAWALQRGAECGAYKRGLCYFATGGRLLPCPMAKLCRGARKERRIQRLRNGRVAKNKHASCVRKEFFNHLGAVCRAQELWLSDNLHLRSRSVRPTRRMSSQHCATGARSRPRCGSRDPANLLITSSGRDERSDLS
jgi:hypothetical protein